jgi:dipeptidyl aminopeptidase/acylaminoacyl peptidase
MKKLVLFVLPLISVSVFAQPKTYWQPEQTLKMKNISSVSVAPGGNKVAYAVREAVMNDERSEYVNQIYVANADGSGQVQLTRNDKNNTTPKWSPDGKWIAFTSNRDGKSNLYLIEVAGGESEKLTDVKTGINDFHWSPNGAMIAYTITDAPSDADEKNKKGKNDWYFMDEDYKQGRLNILWVHSKDSSGKRKILNLTKENLNVSSFNWAPDNEWIAYTHGVSSRVNDQVYSDVSILNIRTGAKKDVATSGAGESNPIFSPDGKLLALEATEDPVIWGGKTIIRILDLANGKSRDLQTVPNDEASLLGWSSDGNYVYVSSANRTLAGIYRLSADGKQITEWNRGSKDYISNISLNRDASHLAFTLQNPSRPADVYVSAVNSFAPVKISNINPELAAYPVPRTELITWKSADGKEIEGLLTYPLHYEKGKKYPFILNVHGGPAGVFNETFIASNSGAYPIAGFAENDIAVLRPNPRGSSGYGVGFRLANQRDWGGEDYKDLMAGVDQVIKMGLADPERLGVMGWSYGGFMSTWIIGHTDRFKAASIGAPATDLIVQSLSDDIGGFMPSYMKANPWEDWNLYNERSPLRYVQNVKTPVLLQHGESDIRVPFSEGVMLYNALKRRNVPVRFLVLPRQPHGPTEPKMIRKVMQTNLDWFSNYLKGDKRTL